MTESSDQNLRLTGALRASGVAWWELDLRTGAIEFDPRKTAMLGRSDETFRHYQDFMALVHPDDVPAVMKSMHDHMEGTAARYETEYRIQTKSGLYKWFHDVGSVVERDAQGAPVRVQGFVMDVTPVRAFSEMLESRNQFHTVVTDSIPGMLAYWTKDLVCEFANRRYLEWFGRTEAEMRGITMQALLGDALFAKNERYIRGALAGEPQRFERTLIKADGTTGYTLAQYLPEVKGGKVVGFVALVTDVTELKQAQLDAEAATRAKSEFLANMSHEIRTPMNAVTGLAYLALQTDLSEQQRDYLLKIKSSADSLLGIINDVLDFSKIEAGKLVLETNPFSLEDLLVHCCDLVVGKAEEKGLELIVDVEESVPVNVKGDALRLGQILTNLLTNAVKFTHRGQIVLTVRRCGSSLREGGFGLSFTVEDSGIGMNDDQESRVFEAFTQADSSITRKFGGTGLGLAIVRNLVRLMGGTLGVESAVDRGSSFTVELPFELEMPASGTPGDEFSGVRVLLVDDNAVTLRVLEQMAKRLGCRTTCAESGPAALTLLSKAGAGVFDVILMDWSMPGMNGIDTMHVMRKLLPATQVIILVTAFEKSALLELGEHSSLLNGLIQKPVRPADLVQELRRVLQPESTSLRTVNRTKPLGLSLTRLSGLRILLVEDNPINLQIAKEILVQAGIIIETASNGREAVERLGRGVLPDLVLMDVQMPVLDGLEATREIRQLLPGVRLPIVAMTAYAMDEEKRRCLSAGMDDHVSKPISPKKLFETILKLIPLEEGMRGVSLGGGVSAGPDLNLPGIDVSDALERLGDRGLFTSLLAEFASMLPRERQELEETRRAGDFLGCRTVLHRIRGAASNLSAVTLAAAVQRLEHAFSQGEMPSDALFSELDAALAEYYQAVGRLP